MGGGRHRSFISWSTRDSPEFIGHGSKGSDSRDPLTTVTGPWKDWIEQDPILESGSQIQSVLSGRGEEHLKQDKHNFKNITVTCYILRLKAQTNSLVFIKHLHVLGS